MANCKAIFEENLKRSIFFYQVCTRDDLNFLSISIRLNHSKKKDDTKNSVFFFIEEFKSSVFFNFRYCTSNLDSTVLKLLSVLCYI